MVMAIIQSTFSIIKSALAYILRTISTIQSSLGTSQRSMSTPPSSTSIGALPPELVSMVLSHLPSTSSSPFSSSHSSLCSALLVCRLWRALGEDPRVWARARVILTSNAQVEVYCACGPPARLALAATLELTKGVELTPELGQALRDALERRESRVVNLSIHSPIHMVPHSLLVKKLSDFLGRQPPGEPKRWPQDGTLDLFPVLVSRLEVLRARSEVHEKLLSGAFLAEVAHKLTTGGLAVRVLDVTGMEAEVAMLHDRWLAEMKKGGAAVVFCHETHKLEVEKEKS